MATTRIRPLPNVTFSTLAKVMGALSPPALASALRGHKYPTEGPKRSYATAQRQLVAYLTKGSTLQSGAASRPHEREAIEALVQALPLPLPQDVICTLPPKSGPWQLAGVDVSVFPEVDLATRHGLGALKVYFGKDPLRRGVGANMAALLHHYKTVVLGQTNVLPRYCLVYEARTGSMHASGRPTKQLAAAHTACQLIAALWPTL